MNIYIGGDHYTLEITEKIKTYLAKKGIDQEYFGSKSEEDKVSLHEFILPVCREVVKNNCFGILTCGTGAGVNIGANKYPGVRAVLCRKEIDAQWAREKDNANVLCLSSWDTPDEVLYGILDNFLETPFQNEKIMKSMHEMEKWRNN